MTPHPTHIEAAADAAASSMRRENVTTYYQDESITLHHGDALEIAGALESDSVDCIVTSPPYYGLRDYGSEQQYGLESTPAEYVETMRALFSELRRVLANDGTLWLNIGDSYSSGSGGGQGKTGQRSGRAFTASRLGAKSSLPRKNLLGMPWRVAFALQDDGWILRNAIIWNKPNAMPESATDRLSGTYEQMFMFSRSQKYWFDLDPIREDALTAARPLIPAGKQCDGSYSRESGGKHGAPTSSGLGRNEGGKNPGDVWSISTQPFSGAHFAVMPRELARRAIVAGCKPCGTVLDPFSGSGTTGLVAQNNGRKYVGIDISADYLKLSLETRLQNAALDFGGAA